uniref:Uncharacterized protein n=1 Tax=Tetranychus urticae TaxID=32264 RepID=T1JQA8_TETUR
MNQFLTLFVTFTAICLTLGTVQATPITTLFQGLQGGSPALGSPDLSALGSPSLAPESLTQLLSTLFPALNSLSPAPAASTQPDISIEVQR